MSRIDLIGRRFGRLVVTHFPEDNPKCCICQCDCGLNQQVPIGKLKQRGQAQCQCNQRARLQSLGPVPLCACGCGQHVTRDGSQDRTFRKGHWRKYEGKEATRHAGRLRRKYGLTYQDYEPRLQEQDGGCKICKTIDPGKGRKHFCVDHNHDTGEVRALLCGPCNSALGRVQEDPQFWERAAIYIETGGFTDTGLTCRAR